MQCWIWPPYKDKGYTEFLENGCDALQCPTLSIFFLGEPKGTNFGWVCSKTYGAHGVCNGLFSSWVLLLSTSHHLQFTFPCSHCHCYSSRWIVLIAVCSYQVLYLSWHLHVMWVEMEDNQFNRGNMVVFPGWNQRCYGERSFFFPNEGLSLSC